MRSPSLNCCFITNAPSSKRGNVQQRTETEQSGCAVSARRVRRHAPLLPPMALIKQTARPRSPRAIFALPTKIKKDDNAAGYK